jgi:predicted ester cyclase
MGVGDLSQFAFSIARLTIKMKKEELLEFANEELFVKGNLDSITEIFSVNYVAHAGGNDYKGHEFLKRFTKVLRTSIPDVKVLKIEYLNETDQTITFQRTLSGTHKINMMGIPPSGKKVKWREMVVSRFEDGKIIEEWVVSELLGELLLKVKK